MPLYVADYLADTLHLSATEHGAFILLLMHRWQHGSLPDDARKLAPIAGVSRQRWPAIWASIKPLLCDGAGSTEQSRPSCALPRGARR
jgi:uncharacterized protein YdaU (DUF1376 family)